MHRFARAALAAALASPLAFSPAVASADAELAPGPSGGLGAFLIAGPVRLGPSGKRPAFSVDFALPSGNTPRSGERLEGEKSPVWQPLSSPSALLDLRALLKTQSSEATAAAYGVLRAKRPFRGLLLLGVDDGVQVEIDGKKVFARDDARAFGDDDDLVPLDLPEGDHPVVIKLHQRGGAWAFRARVTGPDLGPPRGLSWVLPGDIDAAKLAAGLVDLSLDRGLFSGGLSPRLKVSVRGGVPRGLSLEVKAQARPKAGGPSLFDVRAGEVPVDDEGVASDMTVSLPTLGPAELAQAEGGADLVVEAQAGGASRSFEASPRKALREALARAERLLPEIDKKPAFLRDPAVISATIEHLSHRLAHYAGRGDADVGAQLDEAAQLEALLDSVEKQADPLTTLRGPRRLAHRSPLDGKPSPFGLYLPRGPLDGSKRYPLVVALHGMNGKPMNMMRWVFGHDDPNHDGEWEDRHVGQLPDYDAIVVTPMAHFNSMYRYVGEEDVVAVMEWAKRVLPVDNDRVSVTGPSMGGTGTAWVAFRYADRFSSAAPLCGYHSYFLRGDTAGRALRPWERALSEERSTVYWAPNGLHLPLWVVHGTKDLPVENSGVLIDRYKSLGYLLQEDHPDEGHNVWQPTYEGLKGMSWLASHRRPQHPSRVVFRTDNLRYDRYAWAKIERLERSLAWGELTAQAKKNNKIELKTQGIAALSLDRDEKLVDAARAVTVSIDGASLEVGPDEPLSFERREGAWKKGITPPQGLAKKARLAGPLRDVHHEPLVVVYGTSDPALARANEEVARWFAGIKPGFEVSYPVVADTELDPTLAQTHALVLVGGPESNAVTRALDGRLPIHVTQSPPSVRAGKQTFTGDELGAAFIYPNPDSPERYVVVLAGADVAGTLRLMSLPDLLPDFVITDSHLARGRGQMVLGPAQLLAGGSFDESWQLPAQLDDPKRK